MSSFSNRDSSQPEFWSERFAQRYTPWEHGGVPVALQRFVQQQKRSYRTLIPGCGTGQEVAFLLQQGWDVMGLDFSAQAVEAARQQLGRWGERVVQADFFNFHPDCLPELIYERAFLCALPPRLWPRVVERWARLLPAHGLLVGYFYLGEGERGPPFGISPTALQRLMAPYFLCIADEPVSDSLPIFMGKERWQIWARTP